MTDTLTIGDTIAIAMILDAAASTRKVSRLLKDGTIIDGIARCVGTEDGCMSPNGTDVRAMYLRVTGKTGFENFWLISDLVAESKAHTFMPRDW